MKESDECGWSGDEFMAHTILRCLKEMRDHTTQDKMTICYNLTSRILRLFLVCGEKESIMNFIESIHEDLKQQVEERFHDR